MPWTWTADGGPVQFLGLPNGYTGGNAVAVSNDRRTVAGNLRVGREGVSTAAVWRDGSPRSCRVLSCGPQLAVTRSTSTLPIRRDARTR